MNKKKEKKKELKMRLTAKGDRSYNVPLLVITYDSPPSIPQKPLQVISQLSVLLNHSVGMF